ncbi:MAG: HEAT repeat domain-containing protein [Candidatus Omnitrophica bacterium]|nr:HEAT repeat domain-containing protein [Candidatus Omnitrophota bacterium]
MKKRSLALFLIVAVLIHISPIPYTNPNYNTLRPASFAISAGGDSAKLASSGTRPKGPKALTAEADRLLKQLEAAPWKRRLVIVERFGELITLLPEDSEQYQNMICALLDCTGDRSESVKEAAAQICESLDSDCFLERLITLFEERKRPSSGEYYYAARRLKVIAKTTLDTTRLERLYQVKGTEYKRLMDDEIMSWEDKKSCIPGAQRNDEAVSKAAWQRKKELEEEHKPTAKETSAPHDDKHHVTDPITRFREVAIERKSPEELLMLVKRKPPKDRRDLLAALSRETREPTLRNIIHSLHEAHLYDVPSASMSLRDIGGREALNSLVKAIGSEKPDFVREAAAKLLSKIKDDRALLYSRLYCYGTRFRHEDTEPFQIEDGSTSESYIEALNSGPEVCTSAAIVLGKIGKKKAARPLSDRLRNANNAYECAAIARALGELGGVTGVRNMVWLYNNLGLKSLYKEVSFNRESEAREALKKALVKSLFQIGTPAVDYMVDNFLNRKGSELRQSTVQLLGEMGNAKAPASLREILKDEQEPLSIRSAAAAALGKLQDKKALPILRKILSSDDEKLHRPCIEAVGMIGEKSSATCLFKFLKAEDQWIRRGAVEALGKLKHRGAVSFLIDYLDETGSAAAAVALGEIGDRRATRPLIKALRSGGPLREFTLEEKAADGLCKMADPAAVKPLLRLAQSDRSSVAVKAITALGEIRDKKTSALLIEILEDEDRDDSVRGAAAIAAGKVGGKKAITALNAILQEQKYSSFHGSVIIGLGHAGSKETVTTLCNLMETRLCKYAGQALVEMGYIDKDSRFAKGYDNPIHIPEALIELSADDPQLLRRYTKVREQIMLYAGAFGYHNFFENRKIDELVICLERWLNSKNPEEFLLCLEAVAQECERFKTTITEQSVSFVGSDSIEGYIQYGVPALVSAVKDEEQFRLFLPRVTDLGIRLHGLKMNPEAAYNYGIPEAVKRLPHSDKLDTLFSDVEKWAVMIQIEDVVAQLAWKAGKPLMKLTEGDFVDNRLEWLLDSRDFQGKSENVCRFVYDRIEKKVAALDITEGLPKGKTILIYAPHPDDDVIPCAGLIQRLVTNGNKVICVFATAGYTAVRGINPFRVVGEETDEPMLSRRAQATQMRNIECTKACGMVGAKGICANLPFYVPETAKRKVTDADVKLLSAIVDDVDPDIFILPGDLNDPHKAHNMAANAMERVLQRRASVKPVDFWYYKGAWTEYSMTEADIFVVLSQAQMDAKTASIKRHWSQTDAVYPGPDDYREFYERALGRNTNTANQLTALGILNGRGDFRYYDTTMAYEKLSENKEFMAELDALKRWKRKELGEPEGDKEFRDKATNEFYASCAKDPSPSEIEQTLRTYEQERLAIHLKYAQLELQERMRKKRSPTDAERASYVREVYAEFNLGLGGVEPLRKLCRIAKLSRTIETELVSSAESYYVEGFVREDALSRFEDAIKELNRLKAKSARRPDLLDSLRMASFLYVEFMLAHNGPYAVVDLYREALDREEVRKSRRYEAFDRALALIKEKGLLLEGGRSFRLIDDILADTRRELRSEGFGPTTIKGIESYLTDAVGLAIGRPPYSIKTLPNDDARKMRRLLGENPEEFRVLYGYLRPFQTERLAIWYQRFLDGCQIRVRGKGREDVARELIEATRLDIERNGTEAAHIYLPPDIFLKGEKYLFDDVYQLYLTLAESVFSENILSSKSLKVVGGNSRQVLFHAAASLTALTAGFRLEYPDPKDVETLKRDRLEALLEGMNLANRGRDTQSRINSILQSMEPERGGFVLAGVILWNALSQVGLTEGKRPNRDYLFTDFAEFVGFKEKQKMAIQNRCLSGIKALITGATPSKALAGLKSSSVGLETLVPTAPSSLSASFAVAAKLSSSA